MERICLEPNCAIAASIRGMCLSHYKLAWKHRRTHLLPPPTDGQFEGANPRWTGDAVTKSAMHKRIRRRRGRAADQMCIDCGQVARDWSQIKGTSGLDVMAHYEPRCRSCHSTYDDKLASTRGIRPVGEDHYFSKLSDDDVREIRRRLQEGETCKRIAEDYPVSWGNIAAIKRRKTWKHVVDTDGMYQPAC